MGYDVEEQPDGPVVFMCGPNTPGKCVCRCPESCEHVWDGPEITERQPGGGVMSSVTCSRCGADAFTHSMWVGP